MERERERERKKREKGGKVEGRVKKGRREMEKGRGGKEAK